MWVIELGFRVVNRDSPGEDMKNLMEGAPGYDKP